MTSFPRLYDVNMKRLLLICVICVACVPFTRAQLLQHSAAFQQFISLSGQFGEHSWTGDVPTATMHTSFGLGTGVGLSYELKYHHFLLSVGVTGAYTRSTFISKELTSMAANDGDNSGHTWTVPGVRGDFTYVYDFYKRKDMYSDVTVQVPLMMGGQWNKFYFLLGAKFQTESLWGVRQASTLFNSYGDYASIMGTTIAHMPEYGFYDNEEVKMDQEPAKFNLNVLASAELGWWIVPEIYPYSHRKYIPVVYRVGLYADCGAFNAYNYDEDLEPYKTPTSYNGANPAAMKNVELNDFIGSKARGELVLPAEIGIKFSVMFMLPTKTPCVLCNDARSKSAGRNNQGRIALDEKKKKR